VWGADLGIAARLGTLASWEQLVSGVSQAARGRETGTRRNRSGDENRHCWNEARGRSERCVGPTRKNPMKLNNAVFLLNVGLVLCIVALELTDGVRPFGLLSPLLELVGGSLAVSANWVLVRQGLDRSRLDGQTERKSELELPPLMSVILGSAGGLLMTIVNSGFLLWLLGIVEERIY
jgi:hypothetical protein